MTISIIIPAKYHSTGYIPRYFIHILILKLTTTLWGGYRYFKPIF